LSLVSNGEHIGAKRVLGDFNNVVECIFLIFNGHWPNPWLALMKPLSLAEF